MSPTKILDAHGQPVGFEGPAYADRVGGRLTFRDWEHWTQEDQDEWRTEFQAHTKSLKVYYLRGWLEWAQESPPPTVLGK